MFFTLSPVDNTRGHCYKLLSPSCNTDIRKYFFLGSYCQSLTSVVLEYLIIPSIK